MTDLIGLDHSEPILERLKQRLSERGVRYVTNSPEGHVFEGMGNKRQATLALPQLTEKPSEEEAESLYAQWLSNIESQLRQR